jgi:hypothetical protein
LPNPYITDDRLETDPPESASFPYEQVIDNRLFEERVVAANMKVQGVKLSAWADRIIDLEAGAGGGSVNVPAELFETRAAAVAATISATVDALRTGGYATAGDGGHGLYKRIANPSSSNRGYFQSADGAWWQLVAEGGVVTIEQFGGVADGTIGATTGTDNVTPLVDALTFYAWILPGSPNVRWSYIIQFGAGAYYFSTGFDIHVISHIRGMGRVSGETVWHTTFIFPPSVKNPFILGATNTDGTGAGVPSGTIGAGSGSSTLEGFLIRFSSSSPVTQSDSERVTAAIWMRTTSSIIDVGVLGAPGHSFLIRAQSGGGTNLEGNANQWNCRDIYSHSPGWDHVRIEGNDANGGRLHGLVTHSGGTCGIYNDASFTNTFTGLQITGYRNVGVHYAGNRYQCISTNAVTAAATTPGTNNLIWYLVSSGGATAQWVEWNSATYSQHVPGLPIFDDGSGSIYLNPYVEVGGAAINHAFGESIITAGTCKCTDYTNWLRTDGTDAGLMNPKGVGGKISFESGQAGYTRNGANTWARVGGENVVAGSLANDGINLLEHYRAADEDTRASWGYDGADIIYRYLNKKYYWEQTTLASTRNFGRASAVPYMFAPHDIALVDSTDGTRARIYGVRGSAPASGEAARGEFFFHGSPSGGGWLGWSTTTGGTYGSTAVSSLAGPVSTDALGYLNFVGDKRATGTFDVNASTVLINHTQLSVNVSAGRTYRFRAVLPSTSNASGGIKFAIGGTATATAITYEGLTYSGAAVVAQGRGAALGTEVGGVTAVTAALGIIEGLITVNAAGTLLVQFAQNASHASNTVILIGATFTVTDVA